MLMAYSLQLFQALKESAKQVERKIIRLLTLNSVKSSSLNDCQQSTFAGSTHVCNTHLGSAPGLLQNLKTAHFFSVTLFTILPVCCSYCCLCGLGFLVCLVFHKVLLLRLARKNPFRNIFRLFPSVSYPG